MKSRLCFLFSLLIFFSPAQQSKIDSLKIRLKSNLHDTLRCSLLNIIVENESDDAVWPGYNDQLFNLAQSNLKKISKDHSEYKLFSRYLANALNNKGYLVERSGDTEKAIAYYNECLKVNEEIGNKSGASRALINLGSTYQSLGNISKALESYEKSLKIQEETGDKQGMSITLNNIGFICKEQGHISKALEYYVKSLKICEEIGDKNGVAYGFNNISVIYKAQGDISKSLEYTQKSLKLREETGDKRGVAQSLNNLGVLYGAMGDMSKTLEYYQKSLKIVEELGDKKGIALALENLGLLYRKLSESEKALEYLKRSLEISTDIGNKRGMASCMVDIGSIYYKKGNFILAEDYAIKSMNLSKELGYPENIRNAAQLMYKLYKDKGEHKKGLENYELYVSMRDSIANEENRKASIKSQLKYEYEKKMATDSVEHAKETEIKKVQIAKQESELNAKKNEQYALFGGLGLVMVFAGFMYNRFRLTQKQKAIIEFQKRIVEEKQKEIVDSIHYARRIQKALITNEKYIQKNLDKLKN